MWILLHQQIGAHLFFGTKGNKIFADQVNNYKIKLSVSAIYL